jgi:hypothetical protein
MPTLASSASCYKICAWSKHEKQWIDASASLIHDTDPNWVSHKLIERLNGQAPRPIFRDVNNVRQKFLGEDTFTWYKEDSPSENRGTVFQIRPKNENLPCDMGIQKCLLFPNEPTVTEGIAVMLDNSNEEHTEKGFTKPEAQDREGEDNEYGSEGFESGKWYWLTAL